jgi:hypothetical protein
MTEEDKKNIRNYLPLAIVVALALFGNSSLKMLSRNALFFSVLLFCWGIAFTAALLDRFEKRHHIRRDASDLGKLMTGSGIYMFNASMVCGYIVEGFVYYFINV